MPKPDKTYAGLLLFLAILCVFPLAIPSFSKIDATVDAFVKNVPLDIGSWKGRELEVDKRTYEILETRNIVSRIYENAKGDHLQLLLVGSKRDRRVAHPPEVCYVSSDFDILDQKGETFSVGDRQIPLREFVARDKRRPENQDEVMYFYKIGDKFTDNYYAQQFLFAMDRLTRKETKVLLVRLSGADKDILKEFLTQVLPYLP